MLGQYDNQFRGLLPHSIATLSTSITIISSEHNQILGTIPLGVENLVNLNAFGMYNNQLTGTIPPAIGELKNLQMLCGNLLEWAIPSSIGNLTLLSNLLLDFNNLQGSIPSSLGKLSEFDSIVGLKKSAHWCFATTNSRRNNPFPWIKFFG